LRRQSTHDSASSRGRAVLAREPGTKGGVSARQPAGDRRRDASRGTSRFSSAAGAANCAVSASANGGSGQVGTESRSGGFSAGNRKIGRDSREGDRAPVGLANHRLQPLGHLTAARILSIRQASTYAHPDSPLVVPEIVPARSQNVLQKGAGRALMRCSSEGDGSFNRCTSRQVLKQASLLGTSSSEHFP
jgi:hypothetical protein